MRRLGRFLNDTFLSNHQRLLPEAGHEMTLHDALRICTGHRRVDIRPPSVQTRCRQIGICGYRSESDLEDQWRRLDDASRPTANLTIILALDEILRGNLRALVRRHCRANRLVIVPCAGHWPGTDSFGDLALASGSLGWSFIELCRDLGSALENAIVAFGHGEQVLVVLPAHTLNRSATQYPASVSITESSGLRGMDLVRRSSGLFGVQRFDVVVLKAVQPAIELSSADCGDQAHAKER